MVFRFVDSDIWQFLLQTKVLFLNGFSCDLSKSIWQNTVCPIDIGPTSQPVLVYLLRFLSIEDKKPTWVHKRVRVQVPEYGSRFPSTGPLIVFYLGPGSRVRVQVPEYGFWTFFLNFFANLFKNVLSFIFGLLLDAVLVCHVIWVVGFQSGLKKIGSSQIYEVEKLAQYRWDIRYMLDLIKNFNDSCVD